MPNTGHNKRIARNTAMLYIRMLFTMVVSLFTSRVVLNAIGVVDFGIYNVVGGIVVMFAFLNGTLGSGTQRFITFQLGKNDFNELKKVFSTSLLLHLCIALIILILAETVGLWFLNNKLNIPVDRMYAAQWVYQFSVFASIISIVQVPYNASIIAHENMTVYAYVSIVEVSLKLLLVYLLLISNYDKLITYSLLIFAVSVIVMSIYRIYCKKKYDECRFHFVWDKEIFQSMLSFSGWNIFGVLAFTGANQGINILLNIFFGPSVNAARAVSYQISSSVNAFVTNFQTAVSPQIVKLFAENKIDELKNLVFQNAKYAFLLLFFISLPILYELDTILYLWLKIVPKNTVLFCRIILLQSLLYSMNTPFIMAIHAVGKTKYINLTGGTALLLVLPISYFLLKMGFPAYVPFIIYILGTIGEFYFDLHFLKKFINLSFKDFFIKTIIPILKVVLISIALTSIVYFLMDKSFIRFLLVFITSSATILFSTYFLAVDKITRIKVKHFVVDKIGL
jgi:O-antigen/teichoic acid export membrane protein